jgi:hypothetical protein
MVVFLKMYHCTFVFHVYILVLSPITSKSAMIEISTVHHLKNRGFGNIGGKIKAGSASRNPKKKIQKLE